MLFSMEDKKKFILLLLIYLVAEETFQQNVIEAVSMYQAMFAQNGFNFEAIFEHRTRCSEWVECCLFTMENDEFFSLFRVSLEFFEVLCAETEPEGRTRGRRRTSWKQRVLIALWVYAHGFGEGARGLAQRFGCSEGFIQCIHEVSERIKEVYAELIQFPNHSELESIANAFQERTGFPGVVGCVDGTHIAIAKPSENGFRYLNRKGFHSLQLQCTCDTRYFIYGMHLGMGKFHVQFHFISLLIFYRFCLTHCPRSFFFC